MIEHAQDIIPLLVAMIALVGGGLLGLLIWIGQRLQKKVDDIPEQVGIKVKEVHDELHAKVDRVLTQQDSIEKDLKADLKDHETRLVRLETRCDMMHGGRRSTDA